ncbi:MAG: DUF2461 domain-containing protein [Ilumatobacteraceae bacterium]
MGSDVPFEGIPPEAFDFYDRLAADNTKAFWLANRSTFETAVKAPVQSLCARLAASGDDAPFHVFRPYNDARFAKGRPPYKIHQGAYRETEGGAGQYLHIGADGMMVATGYYGLAKDQLDRYRRAVADDRTGLALVAVTAALAKRGYSVGARDELRSAPRGYPKDHPRIELLRRKGLIASRQFAVAPWMSTAKAAAKVRDTWAGAAALCEWMDANVGPSTLPPDDGWR